MTFNNQQFRQQFPLIMESDQCYFDSAATSQKPQMVIDVINEYYTSQNANVHRAAHKLSAVATAKFELARTNIGKFIGCHNSKEIIFTKGTTEAINLIAQSYGRANIKAHHNIVVSVSEHHANIVPWQQLCLETGAQLRVIPLTSTHEFDLLTANELIDENTAIVAVAHASNVTGVINPIGHLIKLAKEVGAVSVIDGAQTVAHLPIDVDKLDCDFFVFSGHKMYGPTGIGILYGKEVILEAMPVWQCGGEMIKKVSFNGTTFNQLPFKFEPGTPNISGVLGLSAAVDFIKAQDSDAAHQYENQLTNYLAQELKKIDETTIIGNVSDKLSVISFIVDDEHPSDIATLLNQHNIAVRSGHHCAMPLMEYLNIDGTIRISIAPYNTLEEVDKLIEAIKKALEFLI
ncbi:aminotransferase class V-fold PLP-dependent enzyme [Psychrobium sp. nBUS_13]|uniref:aminotransferase class V-fold PLP-dependent enzyme n=1 Tax=Psychrobium sp. nBUS_13 TaxID=3395319 RepID=UPI003EB86A2D